MNRGGAHNNFCFLLVAASPPDGVGLADVYVKPAISSGSPQLRCCPRGMIHGNDTGSLSRGEQRVPAPPTTQIDEPHQGYATENHCSLT